MHKNNLMTWPTKKLGEIVEKHGVIPAKIKRNGYRQSGKYPVVDQGENLVAGYIDDERKLYRGDLPVVVFGDHTRILKYIDFPFAFGADGIKILRPQEILLPKFFYYVLVFNPVSNQGYKRHFSFLTRIKIPLPPLAVQKQVVGRLDKIAEAQKLNDELIKKTDELFRSLLHKELNPAGRDWKIKTLGDLFEITSSKRVFESEWTKQGISFYRAREIVSLANNQQFRSPLFISEKMYEEYKQKYGAPKEGDILVTGVGTIGISYIVKKTDKFYFKDGNIIWLKQISHIDAISQFVEYFFQTPFFKHQIKATSAGATVLTYTIQNAKKTKIPLPSLEIQKQIVEKLSAVQEYKKQLLEQKLKLKELFDSVLSKSMKN